MEDLLAGYRRFRREIYPAQGETYRTLASEGQSPRIMVIGCCDSRVDPAAIFDAGPGALFVLRNVANLVPPYATDGGHHGTSAAIEFAVGALGVDHILVLGHASCGGIRALVGGTGSGSGESNHIERWMSIARPALEAARADPGAPDGEELAHILEKAVIGHSLANLEGFPAVRDAMAQRGLRVHGAWFDIEAGSLHLLDRSGGTFRPVEAGSP